MLPSVIANFFPGRGIEPIAEAVEKVAVAIVDEAAR